MSGRERQAERAGFARRLRMLMAQRGMSPKTLAATSYASTVRQVYAWTGGKSLPDYHNLVGIRRALNCSWADLFGE